MGRASVLERGSQRGRSSWWFWGLGVTLVGFFCGFVQAANPTSLSEECRTQVELLSPVTIVSTDRSLRFEDRLHSGFYGAGDLVSLAGGKQALRISISTKMKDSQGREVRGTLRGKACFERILRHFEGRFDSLQVTYTSFGKHSAQPMSEMLDAVNAQTAAGATLETAVHKTFFAEQARKHGYGFMIVDGHGGRSGHYEAVEVRFYREKPSWWSSDFNNRDDDSIDD